MRAWRPLNVALVAASLAVTGAAPALGQADGPAPPPGAAAAAQAQQGGGYQGGEQRSGEVVRAEIIDFDFNPDPITVSAGTTVVLTNNGQRPHTATDRGGTFDTGPIAPGGEGSVTLTVPGRYRFFCRINPGKMNGLIVVEGGDEPARVSRIEALDPAREGEKLRFDPAELTIPAGGTVVFANVGGKPHTLTADNGAFDTGTVTPGAEGGRFAGNHATFSVGEPGRYPFHCKVHPSMRGVLVVEGEEPAATRPPPAGAPRQVRVEISGFAFDPPEVSVAPGGTVTWKNTDKVPHTATFDGVEGLDTGSIQFGQEGSVVAPARPGSYSYRCALHPARMRAVLVVLAAGVADPAGQQGGEPAAAAPPGPAPPAGADRVSWFILASSVLGAFFGGFGVAILMRGRPRRNLIA